VPERDLRTGRFRSITRSFIAGEDAEAAPPDADFLRDHLIALGLIEAPPADPAPAEQPPTAPRAPSIPHGVQGGPLEPADWLRFAIYTSRL
jgi:hypothetical protein